MSLRKIEILPAGETGPRRLDATTIMKIQGVPFLTISEFVRAKLKVWAMYVLYFLVFVVNSRSSTTVAIKIARRKTLFISCRVIGTASTSIVFRRTTWSHLSNEIWRQHQLGWRLKRNTECSVAKYCQTVSMNSRND